MFIAGTSLNLTYFAALPTYINNNESVNVEWYRNSVHSLPENRHSVVMTISRERYYGGNYTIYTSILTISPLADEDDDSYGYVLTVTGGTGFYLATASLSITVIGK